MTYSSTSICTCGALARSGERVKDTGTDWHRFDGAACGVLPKRFTGITTVKLRVNRAVWERVEREAQRVGASAGVVIAAAMDAYDEKIPQKSED